MNLILTPVYNAFDRVKQMCEAIDKHSVLPYLHILIDDNSDSEIPLQPSEKRRILRIRSDYPQRPHKNQLGQAIQLGYDYARQTFVNEQPNPAYDYVFLIESDVIVQKDWDKKQIDLIPSLPDDWATLDVASVDEQGKLTFPTTVSPRYAVMDDGLEWTRHADFQCTLFNPILFKKGIKFSAFPSHFDILWSRATTQITGRKHYRTQKIQAIHYAGSSREILMAKEKQRK